MKVQKGMQKGLLLGLFGGLCLPLHAAPEPARAADDFVDRIGVATHWGYSDTPYGYAYDQIKTLLGESGIRHVRDGFHPHLQDLYKTYGIKATVLYGPGTAPAEAVSQLKDNLSLVDMVEGPNEVDIFASSASYKGSGFPEGPRAYQNALYAAIKADPVTRVLGVIAPSTARSDSNVKLAPLLSEDYLVMHSYAGGGPPETSLTGGLVSNPQRAARLLGPNQTLKPIVVTESGYHTALNGGGGVIAGVQPGVSEAAEAKYLPRHFASYFNAGIVRTFTYEFADEFTGEDTNAEAAFGIVRHDLTPKPAFYALKTLIGLLGEARWDAGAGKWVSKPFAPRALDFTLTADARTQPGLRHTLLQKSSGDFYLLVWQEVPSFDREKRQDIDVSPAQVTLTLQTPIGSAATFLPGQSGAVQKTWSRPKTLTLSVPDEILVVRLSPVAVAPAKIVPPPVGLKATATGDAATLSWAAAPARAGIKGYFVSRLGQFLKQTAQTTFTDTQLQPATGYPYTVQSYDAAGRVSAPVRVVALTPDTRPNLVPTELSLSPAAPRSGDPVRFAVTVKNTGRGPTPAGVTLGIGFFVDGSFVSWSDTRHDPLLPGESVTLAASSGPQGSALWSALPGAHTVTAQVDDVDRITETSETDNSLKKEFTVP